MLFSLTIHHSDPLPLRVSVCNCILFILLVTASGDAPAQVSESGPEALVSSELPSGFGDVNEAIRDVEGLTEAFQDTTQLDALAARLRDIESQFVEQIEVPLQTAPLERRDKAALRTVTVLAARQQAALNLLESAVSDAISDVGRREASLLALETAWRAIRDDAETSALPSTLSDALQRVVEGAAAGRLAASERLGQLVALQSDALALSDRLTAIRSAVEAQERAIFTGLFEPEREPLWSMSWSPSAIDIPAGVAEASRTMVSALQDLVDTHPGRLSFQSAGAVVVLLILLILRHGLRARPHADLQATLRVLDHPLAVTAILALTATHFLYPTAQPPVEMLNSIAYLTAGLIVLGGVLKLERPAVLWMAGLLLAFARLTTLLPNGSLLHRLTLLLAALGIGVLLYRSWRVARADPIVREWRGLSALRLLLIAFGVLVALAALANLLGALDLAMFTLDAVVASTLAALGLLTLALVLRDLVAVLLGTRIPQRFGSIRHNRASITASIRRAISLFAGFLWIWATLMAFQLMGVVRGVAAAVFGASMQIGELTISVSTLVIFVLSVWLAVYLSRLVRFFLDQDVLPGLDLPRGVPGALSTGIHYLIIAASVLFAIAASGVDVTQLAIVIGALGVGIGFGLQNIVNNFVSGLILLLERPIQVGDHVQIGSLMGSVRRIGIRASTVRTYEGSEVIVPNGDLISGQLINYTLSDRARRLEARVGVAYGCDLDQTHDVLLEAVSAVENVLHEPAPLVLFQGFGESSLDFRVLFWIADFDQSLKAASDARLAIHRALASAGITIPFPQRDLYVRSLPNGIGSAADPQLPPARA